ncbi:MAG: hypothetical protein ACP5SH_16655 [Syntrophobacteraceae bacterium]
MRDQVAVQRSVVLCGLVVIIIMGLFPPWSRFGLNVDQVNAGYACLFSPPVSTYSQSVQVDMTRLLMQWALVALSVAAILLFLKLLHPSKPEVIVPAETKEQNSGRSPPPQATQQCDEADVTFENRVLCEDDACIGILNSKGICTECGRTPIQIRAKRVDIDDLTYSGLPWKNGK